MSDYIGERKVGDYEAHLDRQSLDEPLSVEDFEQGVDLVINHDSGRRMTLTVHGTSEEAPLIKLDASLAAMLDDDLLRAAAQSLGLCTMEIPQWPDYFLSDESEDLSASIP